MRGDEIMYKMKRADYVYMEEINKKIDTIKHITEYNQIDKLIFNVTELELLCIGYNAYQRINQEEK